jgi:hypothetical protein
LTPALGTKAMLPCFPAWLEEVMETVVDMIMHTFSMMNTLSDEQAREARSAVADYLTKNPQKDERKAAIEALVFLRGRGA